MNKKALTERDICTKFITPALKQTGWDEMSLAPYKVIKVHIDQDVEGYRTGHHPLSFWPAMTPRDSDKLSVGMASR